MGNRPFSVKVNVLRTETTMSNNGKYYSESPTRNTMKSKIFTGIFKKKKERKAKRNEDEIKNAVRERELKVHRSNMDISVPCSSTSVMKLKRFWLMMTRILQS